MTPISLIRDISLTLRGIIAYHSLFKKSCTWDKERIREFQFQHLKKLLIESYSGTAYYHELFDAIKFNPRKDFNSLEDLEFIPVLTKDKAKEVKQYLENPKYARNAMRLRTSGSTGEPFEIAVSDNAWVVEQAVVWRHWAWGGYGFRDRLAMVRSYAPKPGEGIYKHDKLKNFYMFSPFNLNDEQIGVYLDVMRKEGISILRGYPSSILTLADFVNRTGYAIPRLKLILTASETLSDNDREIIEKAFKTKVSNHYGLAEIIVMMGDCGSHCGLHNYDDYGYLELHDTDNPFQKKIIGTHLHNLATPLIRYDTGDIAEINNVPITCKHNFVTLHNIIGRKDQYIKTPEGYQIPTVNFYTLFESFQQVSRWQIVQHSLDYIEIIIQIRPGGELKDEELYVELYKRLPTTVKTNISRNKYFVQKNEGKINPFVSFI